MTEHKLSVKQVANLNQSGQAPDPQKYLNLLRNLIQIADFQYLCQPNFIFELMSITDLSIFVELGPGF